MFYLMENFYLYLCWRQRLSAFQKFLENLSFGHDVLVRSLIMSRHWFGLCHWYFGSSERYFYVEFNLWLKERQKKMKFISFLMSHDLLLAREGQRDEWNGQNKFEKNYEKCSDVRFRSALLCRCYFTMIQTVLLGGKKSRIMKSFWFFSLFKGFNLLTVKILMKIFFIKQAILEIF